MMDHFSYTNYIDVTETDRSYVYKLTIGEQNEYLALCEMVRNLAPRYLTSSRDRRNDFLDWIYARRIELENKNEQIRVGLRKS